MAASAWGEFGVAVQTRLTGDATLVALLGTSPAIYQSLPKTAYSGQYPFVVWNRDDSAPQDGFNQNMDLVNFTVKVELESDGTYGSDSPQQRMDLILKRVKGDWEEQATRAPSYGLDRWVPGALASTGYSVIAVQRSFGPTDGQNDELLTRVIGFRAWMFKNGA